MSEINETKQAEIDAAVKATEERHPGLSHVISGCLVGWPDLTIPPIVYQALVVKVGEFIDAAPGGDTAFCDGCDVSLDLHYGDDDCDAAQKRAGLVERYPAIDLSPRPLYQGGETDERKISSEL